MLTCVEFSCIVPVMSNRPRHNRNPEKRIASRQHIAYDVEAPNGYSVASTSIVDVRTSARYRLNRYKVEQSLRKPLRHDAKPILNDTRGRMSEVLRFPTG